MTNTVTSSTKSTFNSDKELFLAYEKTKVFDEHGKLIKSDNKLRNELALRNNKLVIYVINKLYSKKKEHKKLREDLLQEGTIGLLSAIEGFKPSLGFQFSTYGILWIRQRINNYLLTQDPTLKIPSHIRIAQNKILKKMKDLNLTFKDLNRENAVAFGVTPKMVDSVNSAFKSKWVVSLEDPVSTVGQRSTGSGGQQTIPTIGSTLEDGAFLKGENSLERTRLIEATKQGLKKLKPRERLILLLRYDIIQTVPKEYFKQQQDDDEDNESSTTLEE